MWNRPSIPQYSMKYPKHLPLVFMLKLEIVITRGYLTHKAQFARDFDNMERNFYKYLNGRPYLIEEGRMWFSMHENKRQFLATVRPSIVVTDHIVIFWAYSRSDDNYSKVMIISDFIILHLY